MIEVKIPKVGDIVVGDSTTEEVKYIKQDSYRSVEVPTNYKTIGVVGRVDERGVLVVHKTNEVTTWATRRCYKLTGVTGDTLTLGLRITASSGGTTLKEISLSGATTNEDRCNEINKVLSGITIGSHEPKYHATCGDKDGEIYIWWTFNHWEHSSITAPSGCTKCEDANFIHINSVGSCYRKNGNKNTNGAVSCMARYLAYYGTNGGNLTSNLDEGNYIKNAIKISTPLNKACYLGEHCAYLRSIFGEGDEGYENYVRVFIPHKPIGNGVMAHECGKEQTYELAKLVTDKEEVTDKYWVPMAKKISEMSEVGIPAGEWYWPSMAEVSDIMIDIKYGVDPNSKNRKADPINKGLELIGGSALSGSGSWWSCSRGSSFHAWFSLGYSGQVVGSGSMYNRIGVFPVALLKLKD